MDPVFGPHSVFVCAENITEEQIPPAFPWAAVILGEGSPDDEHPGIVEQRIDVLVCADVLGDPMGEHAIVGGATGDVGHSAGKGVAEVSARALGALARLTGADGARVRVSATSLGTPATLVGRHIVTRVFSLDATCSVEPEYVSPQLIQFYDGVWSWYGAHCSTRYDFKQFRLVRKAGSVPSVDPSDGTTLYTGTSTSFATDKLLRYTYTVFADYSLREGGAVDFSSPPIVGSYLQ